MAQWSEAPCNTQVKSISAPMAHQAFHPSRVGKLVPGLSECSTGYIGRPLQVIVKARYAFNHLQTVLNEVKCTAHPSEIDQRREIYPFILFYVQCVKYSLHVNLGCDVSYRDVQLASDMTPGTRVARIPEVLCKQSTYRYLCESGMPSQFVYRWAMDSGKCQSFAYGYCLFEWNHPHPRTAEECEMLCN
ncbi:unnamed protein product [Angiostrongylus costaricensis]|uniref:BPTI/Kunitz inhibitor domain-containing protein n=1 Tax=Angiostrongylus costaricensis TaxID=334426 RepID=A0A0R3PK78_ANGCS|nr:unnamed protein product [Angiostrongylus costaricensis]